MVQAMSIISFMEIALDQARQAWDRGEVPVGAVVVDGASGEVLAADGNRTVELSDPIAHAEILAIRRATDQSEKARLEGCDIYVTLEPCAMCAGAISLARIRRLYFASYDAKGGGVEHGARVFDHPTCNHSPEVIGGMDEIAAAELLKKFFKKQRDKPRD